MYGPQIYTNVQTPKSTQMYRPQNLHKSTDPKIYTNLQTPKSVQMYRPQNLHTCTDPKICTNVQTPKSVQMYRPQNLLTCTDPKICTNVRTPKSVQMYRPQKGNLGVSCSYTFYNFRHRCNIKRKINTHSFIKSWFFGMQQFLLNPATLKSFQLI